MALLSFRLGIVFTIGLLLLNGFTSDSSVLAFVNGEGPERLRLIAAPPAHVIVTGTRSSPVYLPCQAELGLDTSEGIPNSSYGDEFLDEHNEEDEEEEEEDDEGYDDEDTDEREEDEDEMEDEFLPHTSPLLTNNNLSNDDRLFARSRQDTEQHQQQRGYFDHRPYSHHYEEEDGGEQRGRGRRRQRRRKRYVYLERRRLSEGGEYYGSSSLTFEYVWYRNGLELLTTSFQNQNLRQSHKGFRLFENGTLRIPYNRQNGNMAAGVYRCMASLVNHQHRRYHSQDSILSTECTVSVAYLERDNRLNFPNNTITVGAQEPIIIPCPFQSYPVANISWSVNKTDLPLQSNLSNQNEQRFFLLQNGSLLISNVQLTDIGRYRCNASNNYVTKNVRSSSVNLIVLSTPPQSSLRQESTNRLLPPLQPLQLSVRAGETLRMHCACYSCKPQWSFMPRHSQIPIPLENFTHQVVFVNVSVERHEGVFTCKTPDGSDRQTFNVTVLVPPSFLNNITSHTSSVVASMAFNCSVAGNPMPTVVWYKNGRELISNYIVRYEYPMLSINTLDPEDEGLYQCMAKNAAGEISASSYLTIRDKQKYRHKTKRLDAIQCYPVDTTSLYLTFAVPPHAHPNIEYVMYYLASDESVRWYSSPLTLLAGNGSLRISGRMIEPFRNYTVFLRACSVSDISGTENIRGSGTPGMKKVTVSRLSKGVQCASQGYPVLSTFFPNNGIFIWWPKYDSVEPTAFTIQLRHNDNSNFTTFTNQIIGTVDMLDDYVTYEEVEPLLGKIDAETNQIQDWLWSEYDGSGSGDDNGENRPRRRRQSQRRNRHAFDLSKDRKQIFDSLATSGAVDVDVPISDVVHAANIRSNASSVVAAVAAAKLSVGNLGDQLGDGGQLRKAQQQITITRVKVAGNVTGILLPNIRSVMVRVLGSISPDGEPAAQDLRHVEWKVIDTDTPRADTINRFQASHIDARSVQFTWSRFVATKSINRCLQLCYKNVNYDAMLRGGSAGLDCQNIPMDASHFNVKDLLPLTMYKAFLKPCESKEALSDILDFQTKHDVPGPVTNHELHRKGGTISITWGPPENRNGVLQGYLVEWINEDSIQHLANLSVDATSFTFPNVTSDERINISLRALSSSGLGIPIYLNLKNYEPVNDGVDGKNSSNSSSSNSQRWLFQMYLIILVLLLFVTIGVCCCLVLRRKACKKASSSSAAGLANRAPQMATSNDGRHHLTIDASAMQMMGMMTGCNSDMHEMQTLINASSSSNYPHANGGTVPNGFAVGTCNQSIGGPMPVAALMTANRLQSLPTKHATSDPIATFVSIEGNIPTRTNSMNGGCTSIPSYKELLSRERIDLTHRRPSISKIERVDDSASVTPAANDIVSTPSMVAVIPTNQEFLMTNGPTSTCTVNDSNKNHSPSPSRIIVDSKQQSPTLSFSSKSSCAVLPSSSSSCSSTPPSSLSPASSQCVIKMRSPLALDSSQCRLLETTLDSNTSTINIEETKQQQLEKPAPPLHPIGIYDYDYATNCDDIKEENESDHMRQLLSVQERFAVPDEKTTAGLAVTRPMEYSVAVMSTFDNQHNHDGCIYRQKMSKPQHREPSLGYRPVDENAVSNNCGDDVSMVKNLQSYNIKSDNDGEEDDDDDEDEELDNSSSLLNTSSLSTKPLHQQNHTSSWNFRRPIIGPNG
ncbi:uncharacterized protein LOC128731364 [Anopheles nili]|uniref:uncharacterized protein LOC128731364 n=1 Tax=Anopheles nili TaxID=185578 RepID=UPI00237A5015|nr:uncharacterized protein LOC128731364 [Anopheles nili]